jgi:hypothetical protein
VPLGRKEEVMKSVTQNPTRHTDEEKEAKFSDYMSGVFCMRGECPIDWGKNHKLTPSKEKS